MAKPRREPKAEEVSAIRRALAEHGHKIDRKAAEAAARAHNGVLTESRTAAKRRWLESRQEVAEAS